MMLLMKIWVAAGLFNNLFFLVQLFRHRKQIHIGWQLFLLLVFIAGPIWTAMMVGFWLEHLILKGKN